MIDLTGTQHLVRLVLRRDRVRLPLWVLGVTGMTWVSADAVQRLYDTPVKVAGYRTTVEDSAASRLLNGTPYGVGNIGGITSYEVSATAAVVVALMVVFTVIRHTRAEEESGAAELLRSAVLGRHAAGTAALLVAAGASVLVGALDSGVLLASGLPVSGSLLHGAALAGVGLAFTSVAALSAQVTSSARGAIGCALALTGALFVVRGVGAVSRSWVVWLSPFGWQEGVRAFGEERWWPLLLLLAFTAVVFAGAAELTSHRDFGSGLVQPRGGSARAGAWLGTPAGLVARSQRGMALGWAAGLLALACLFGALGKEVVDLVESNPEIADVFGDVSQQVLPGYFSFAVAFLGVLSSAYAISSAMRLRHEETAGRAEAVLATGVSRTRWALAHVGVTVVGTLAILLLTGLGLGLTHALVSGDDSLVGSLVGASLGTAPAVLLLASVVVLLTGLAPRWVLLGWLAFAFALLQTYLGDLLELPDWLAGTSPFWHLSLLPAEQWDPVPAAVITGLAALLAAIGVLGMGRRDLAG